MGYNTGLKWIHVSQNRYVKQFLAGVIEDSVAKQYLKVGNKGELKRTNKTDLLKDCDIHFNVLQMH